MEEYGNRRARELREQGGVSALAHHAPEKVATVGVEEEDERPAGDGAFVPWREGEGWAG